jgi:hypothetical protein
MFVECKLKLHSDRAKFAGYLGSGLMVTNDKTLVARHVNLSPSLSIIYVGNICFYVKNYKRSKGAKILK